MDTRIISLEFLRMALARKRYLVNTVPAAVSTPYRPMAGRGCELLHGECVIFDFR